MKKANESDKFLLPKKETLERRIRAARFNQNKHPATPTDRQFNIPDEYKDLLVLWDTGESDPDRIIVCGDDEMLKELSGGGNYNKVLINQIGRGTGAPCLSANYSKLPGKT